jgi:F-type H+-transporting ATPase subunit beta
MKTITDQSNHSTHYGKVISVRGSVVDVWFEKKLPSIYSVLHTGKDKQIKIEVLTQLDANQVRGIALTPTQGLARGMSVETNGKQLNVPVGKK